MCIRDSTSTHANLRWRNIADVQKYAASLHSTGQPQREEEPLSDATKKFERILLGLRTRYGVPLSLLQDQKQEVESLIAEGLGANCDGTLRLTEQGLLRADAVAAQLMISCPQR